MNSMSHTTTSEICLFNSYTEHKIYDVQETNIGHNNWSKKTTGKCHGKNISLSDDTYYVQENVVGHNTLSKETNGKYHGKEIRLTRFMIPGNTCADTVFCRRKQMANIMARTLVCLMAIVHRSFKTRCIMSGKWFSDTIDCRRKQMANIYVQGKYRTQ